MTEDMEKELKALKEGLERGSINIEEYNLAVQELTGSSAAAEPVKPQKPVKTEKPVTTPNSSAPAPVSPPAFEAPKIHVSVGGKTIGAFDRDTVIKKIQSGEIGRNAMVWQDGMKDWTEAQNWSVLEKYFNAPPPQSISPPPPSGTSIESPVLQAAQDEAVKAEAEDIYQQGMDIWHKALAATFGKKTKEQKAFECFEKAAMMGHVAAQTKVGNFYFFGWGVKEDRVKAVEWYIKASDQGNAEAQKKLGDCYRCGVGGLQKNFDKAIELYTNASAQGEGEASDTLGYMYRYGVGVQKDEAKAEEWDKLAVKQKKQQGL